MHRNHTPRRGTLCFVAVVAVLAALTAPGLARADTVTEWNLNATNALMVTAAQPPQQSCTWRWCRAPSMTR